jgi:hypothetical protein
LDGQVRDAVRLKSFRVNAQENLEIEIEVGRVPEVVSFGVFASHRGSFGRYGFLVQSPADAPRTVKFTTGHGDWPKPATDSRPTEIRLGSDDANATDIGAPRYWARDIVFKIPADGDERSATVEVTAAMQKPAAPRIDLDRPPTQRAQ